MKRMIKFLCFVPLVFIVFSCSGGSIESRNDDHIRNMERAFESGDVNEIAEEMSYFDEYDDNGGRFTKEQEDKFKEMSRKYPESIRQARRIKNGMND